MFARFWSFGRPYLRYYLLGFLLLVVTNGLGLAIPWLMRRAVNGLQAGAALSLLTRDVLLILAIALVQAGVRTVSRWTVLGASRHVVYDVRKKFFVHLQQLGTSFYDRQRTGDVMSRAVNDVRQIQVFFAPAMLNIMNTTIVYVAVLILLFQLDRPLALAAMALYPPLFLIVNRLSKRTYRYSIEVQEQLGEISNHTQENLSGIQQVKTYVRETREIEKFRLLCNRFRERSLAVTRIRGAMMAVIGIVSGMTTLLVLYLGGQHVIEGRITLGDFVAFNAYLAMLVGPTIALGWIINIFQRGAGSMRRLIEFFDAPATVPLPSGGVVKMTDPVNLEIRNLTFTYTEGGPRVLKGVSFHVAPGERVALVGEVGSGKSTVVSLIAGIYTPPRGSIFLGGQDVCDIELEDLRAGLGVVPQESFLFSRSIRDNLAMRRPQASKEEVLDVLRRADFEKEVASFPEALGTVVGERGFTLSGGQRQRVALARALLDNPPLLLLDDALSSVDSDTERVILDRFLEGADGRSCLFVSHRLSTLAGMDRIVVLRDGRVVEQGTHESLVAQKGEYHALFVRRQIERSMEADP